MVAWLDLGWVRAGAYLLLAGLTIALWTSERRRSTGTGALWPPFWILTALLLVAMAVGRLVDVGSMVTELGRDQAKSSGWYGSRRRAQAVGVGGIAVVWFVSVFVAIWRVPERRRRYLPMAVVSASLVCFAAVRLISLHHVDTVLYHRTVAGVRPVIFVEYGLLLAASTVLAWAWACDHRTPSSSNSRIMGSGSVPNRESSGHECGDVCPGRQDQRRHESRRH